MIRNANHGFALVELLLILALLALLFQLFPSLYLALDVRNWWRGAWMALNVGIVLLLVGLRFGRELYVEWCQRKRVTSGNRQHQQKQLTVKQERELYERMREARKRQVV